MAFQATPLRKGHVTEQTGQGSFTSVGTSVCLQCVIFTECFWTLIAFVWLRTSVCPHVLCKGPTVHEPLSACLATIWPFSGMLSPVNIQVIQLFKGLATVLAFVRSFVAMLCSHVSPKGSYIWEAESAFQTGMRFLLAMGDHMSLKTSFSHELRTTDSAKEFLLFIVDHQMFLQVALFKEGFSTLVTLEIPLTSMLLQMLL